MRLAGRDRDVASVSECIAKRPDDWVKRWNFNRATFWNTEAQAWACVPDKSKSAFRIFAYSILPLVFDTSGIEKQITIEQLFRRSAGTAIRPASRRTAGHDVVERDVATGMLGFWMLAALPCSGMAEEIPQMIFA